MGTITIKSKNKVPNLDAINAKDAYAVAKLAVYDMLTHSGRIYYGAEIETTDDDGNVSVKIRQDEISNFDFTAEEVQQLFQVTGEEILQGENFDTEIRNIIAQAFLYQVVVDQRYGLTANDWEVI